ncbi:hypothetical protein Gpo141_00011924 [Globisporangium polare]
MSTYHQLQHQGEDHAASPPHSSSSFRVTPLNMAISPEQAVQQVILATKKKHEQQQEQQKKAKPKRMRKDNSARAKRYREKKKGQLELTLAEVEKLRAHVRELSTLRQIFLEKAVIKPNATSGSPLRFVHEYFEVFRYGMQLPTPTRGGGDGGNVPYRAICGQRQTQFMNAMTNVDVQFGEAIGIAPAMEQWKMYSALYSTLFLEFLSFRMDTIADSTLVSTTGVLHMRYTRATVAALFPHALVHEELVAKLVGKEVHLKYTDQWYFDESGKVFRYELNPDMVQALYEAVGSLQDVSILLGGGALIEYGAHIKPDAAARIEEILLSDRDDDDDEETESDASRSSSPQPSSAAMAIEFLLS